MSRRPVSPEEVVAALHKVDLAIAQGVPISKSLKSVGIASATYYRWRNEYAGMTALQVKRLMELKQENARLRDRVETLGEAVIWDPASEHQSLDGVPTSFRPPERRRGAKSTR
ncbi:MAG: transposase [Alphaproteobacteria bacterium]|nr:transposase [Alphaproteobacteria bacterium]